MHKIFKISLATSSDIKESCERPSHRQFTSNRAKGTHVGMEAMPKCKMEKEHKEKRKQTQKWSAKRSWKKLKDDSILDSTKKKRQTYGKSLWLILMLMSVSCHKYDWVCKKQFMCQTISNYASCTLKLQTIGCGDKNLDLERSFKSNENQVQK